MGQYTIHTDRAHLGRLPFMGYNTWNAFHCNINETVVAHAASRLKALGLADAGYNFVNIDDCYSEKERNADGDIVAGWYDNCAVPFDEILREGMVGKYARMAEAIQALAKESGQPPMIFSLCQWGKAQPWLWAKRFGQSWRTTGDIEPRWDSITDIINQNSFIAWASDFYGHNDLDMLEVGNGDLTYDEAKSHFTVWALLKSPLLIMYWYPPLHHSLMPDYVSQLASATDETLAILTNPEIIAINQDNVVGTSVTPFRWGKNPDWTFDSRYPAQYWSGASENGTVFMLLNVLDEPADMFFTLTESPWIRAGRQYTVRDLWAHTGNGTAVRNVTVKGVPAHGVVALLLKDAGDEPEGTQPPCAQPDWCIDKNGTLIEPRNEL
ncbi:hypothetical protein ONZ45_g18557 [Pleurotus djamor]|nr:hypothetical protein ONZ45_g18557 [Pleurotus djamor]